MQNKYSIKTFPVFLHLIVGVVVFMLSGCYNESNYSGDGQLKDSGPSAATDRYVLNLGTVDLSNQGTQKYRIKNLPVTNFVAGINVRVDSKNQEVVANKQMNPLISLLLLDQDEKVIFKRESGLASWAWARRRNTPTEAFIYGSGQEETYFDPKPNAEYILALTVHKLDPNIPKHTAVLLLKSGGWK